MKLGVEVLFEQRRDLIRGRRIGLITNPSGVDRSFASIVERFRAEPDAKLVALYGPEHGVRGNAQAGDDAASARRAVSAWAALRPDLARAATRTVEEIEAGGGGWTFAKLTIANAALRELAADAASGRKRRAS